MTVILITGATRGIGRAIVDHALRLSGIQVFAVARSESSLAEFKKAHTDRFDYLAGDVTQKDVCEQAVAKAIARFGRLDALIQNAGILEPLAKVADADVDAWKRLFDVNLFSVLELSRVALPELRRNHGAIVTLGSGAAVKAYQGWGAYCASKAAVHMLTASLAIEESDVTSIVLRPGATDTDMQAKVRGSSTQIMNAQDHALFTKLKNDGALVKPEDCSLSVLALACLARGSDWSGKDVVWNDTKVLAVVKELVAIKEPST